MGRPAGPPEKVRRNRVTTFLTDAEFKKLEQIADDEDRPLSAIVHDLLSKTLKRRK